MKKLLVVVDMQNDFIDGSLGTSEARAIVPAVVDKVRKAKAETIDIFFTQDTHTKAYLYTQEGKNLPVKHCIKPEKGWDICLELQAYTEGEKCIEKPSFGSVDLAKAAALYDEITLVGLCTDICVISNALLLKSFYPEKQILVDSRCCAGVAQESHRNALAAMKMCQITILL